METTWGQHGDHGDMETTLGQCGDNMGMMGMWRPHGDNMETTWGQHEDNLDLIEIIQFCLKIYDLLTHPYLWVGVWVVGWMVGLICGSMGGVRSYQ